MKATILQERRAIKETVAQRYSQKNLGELKSQFLSMVMFAIYWIIFLTILLNQLTIPQTFSANSMKDYITGVKFELSSDAYFNKDKEGDKRHLQGGETPDDKRTKKIFKDFNEIDRTYLINDWLNNVLYSVIYESKGSITKDPDELSVLSSNHVIGDPALWIGIRKLKESSNSDSDTNEIITHYIEGQSYDPYDKMGDQAETKIITLKNGISDGNGGTEDTIKYVPEGTGKTLIDSGGYIFSFPRDRVLVAQTNYWGEPELVTKNWVNIFFIFFTVNVHTNTEAANLIYFENSPAGEITPWFETRMKRRYYETPIDGFRAFLEVIFVLMTCYYWYILFKGILLHFVEKQKKRLAKQPEHMKSYSTIVRFLGITSSFRNISSCGACC